MTVGTEMQLKAILDKTSAEKSLIESVQQLHALPENHDFWKNITRDENYSVVHRRVALVQYFVRHSFQKKVGEIGLGSLNLAPFDLKVKVNGIWTSEYPVHVPPDNDFVRIHCDFGDAGAAAIYLATFPNTWHLDLVEILFGRKSDSCRVVTDVAVSEELTSGAYIDWKRWQQGQVYEYVPPP